GVGLDMTRRDIQGEAKKLGRPWEMGKSFDESAPITALKSASQVGHPAKGAIWLKVNGAVKQQGDLSQQIWSVPEQISYLSNLITLQPGDLIFSGTPAGVGPIVAGDKLEGHVDGVGLGMTRRDSQGEAKKMGRPWEMGKSFDESAPVTALKPASQIGHPAKGAIWLKVNGQVKQQGDLSQQIWSVPEQIAYLSNLITLQPGDLIFSGTPAGVGPVVAGDKLEGHVDGVGDLKVSYKK
ncbi:MAG TPA: fumarylacetoacetate hydrolase family protein, partial [Usitatibacter sp.]|nr:fumarylacetoacetate hydrolase family protein [Usitatibacter sp.]